MACDQCQPILDGKCPHSFCRFKKANNLQIAAVIGSLQSTDEGANRIKESLAKSRDCHLVAAQRSAQSALQLLQEGGHEVPNYFEVLAQHCTELMDHVIGAQELHRALKRIGEENE